MSLSATDGDAVCEREYAGTTPVILLVDDDVGAIRLMARILDQIGTMQFATNGPDALRLARGSPPDLILLDAEMPGMSGFDLLQVLKSDTLLADVPVVFITGHAKTAFEVSALQMGAVDFITKPFRSEPVLARVRSQLRAKRASDDLRRAASTDGLTGIANRRTFDAVIQREWLRTRRSGEAISLLLIDVDHFKLYNDRYGHPGGDVCLQRIARVLQDVSQRPADRVARYGGEEFVVLLPNTPRDGALCVAERILEAVAALAISHQDSPITGYVTVSIGIACDDGAGGPSGARSAWVVADLIRAADRALYRAKSAGRARANLQEIDVG